MIDIDPLLANGWELIKSSSSSGYFLLLPPLKDSRRGKQTSWKEVAFGGKIIKVPEYVVDHQR